MAPLIIYRFNRFIHIINILFFYFRVNITYIDKNGTKIPVRGKVGDNVMYLAHRYGIELEGKTWQIVH